MGRWTFQFHLVNLWSPGMFNDVHKGISIESTKNVADDLRKVVQLGQMRDAAGAEKWMLQMMDQGPVLTWYWSDENRNHTPSWNLLIGWKPFKGWQPQTSSTCFYGWRTFVAPLLWLKFPVLSRVNGASDILPDAPTICTTYLDVYPSLPVVLSHVET